MNIAPIDFDDPQVLALLRVHLEGMHASSPPGTNHALDLSGLRRPEVIMIAAWAEGALLGFGALKELDAASGEVKSMRTAPAHLRRGAAAAILERLLEIARERQYCRVSLETGSGAAFEPALALYRRRGFIKGEAFGGYAESPFNQFYHLDL